MGQLIAAQDLRVRRRVGRRPHQTLPLISRSVTGAKGPVSSFSSECPGACAVIASRGWATAGLEPREPRIFHALEHPCNFCGASLSVEGVVQAVVLLERLLQARPSLPPAALAAFPSSAPHVRASRSTSAPHQQPRALPHGHRVGPQGRLLAMPAMGLLPHPVENLVIVHSAEAVLCVHVT